MILFHRNGLADSLSPFVSNRSYPSYASYLSSLTRTPCPPSTQHQPASPSLTPTCPHQLSSSPTRQVQQPAGRPGQSQHRGG